MKSFPFDSVVTYDSSGVPSFDRAVNSEILAGYFHLLYTDGVFPVPGTNLQVTASAQDMSVVVKPGNVNIQGRLGIEETERTLVFEAAGTVYDRIDAVVARLNTNYDYRKIDLYVVKGIEASVPVAPELTRSGGVYELRLANVFIAKNTTVISSERITDTRLVTSDCGIVTPNPEKLDTEPLFEQFHAELESFKAGTEKDILEWFESIKEKLDEDPAANLQNQIGNITELKTDEKRNLVNAVNEVHELAENVGSDYDSSISYQVGYYCLQKNVLYRCIKATAGTAEAPEEFDADKWETVEVAGELSKQNERLDDLESSIITTTDKTLPDSKAGMVKVNKVLGKSEQDSTGGSQLAEAYIAHATNQYGVALYVTTDLKPSTTYTLSFKGVDGNHYYANEKVFTTPNDVIATNDVVYITFTTMDTLDATDSTQYNVDRSAWIILKNKIDNTTHKFDEFMFVEGTEQLPYEPYTGGQPSPNPDYPQEIKSVVVSGVKTCGNQLFDAKSLSLGNNTSLDVSDDGYTIVATGGSASSYTDVSCELDIDIVRGKDLFLITDSIVITNTEAKCSAQIVLYKSDGTVSHLTMGKANTYQKATLSVPEDANRVMVAIKTNNSSAPLEIDNTVTVKGLRVAFSECEWEPYTGSEIQLSEPVTLHAIGDVMDELTPDGVVRKILKETVTLEKGTVYTNTTRYNGVLTKKVKGKYVSGYCSICHKYSFSGDDYVHFYCDQNSDGVRLFLDNSIITQPAEADIAMVLSEEYTEPLQVVDQIALRSLKTFDGATYITVDSPVEPGTEVEYATNNTGANILDASAKSEKNTIQLGGLSFGIDGEGNYGYFKADDSFVPFKSGAEFFLNPSAIPSEHFILVIQKTAYGGLEKVSCSDFQYLITNCTVSNVIHEFAENTFADAGDYKGVVSWCYILECTATKEQVGQSLSVTVTHSSDWNGTQTYTDNTVFAVTI